MPALHQPISNILLAAADRADLLVDDGTGTMAMAASIEPTAALVYANMELAALWDVLIATYEDYCIRHKKIYVQPSIEDYSLPSDFYKFRKVFPIVNGKRGTVLKKFDLKDLGEADSLSAILTSPIEQTRYKINGNRLWLHPIPTTAAQLELWYIPQFSAIQNPTDLVDIRFPFGWDDYLIEGLAARFLEKEESDSTPQRTRQREILQRILTMAEDRDVGEPFQMIDAEGYLDR